MHKFPQGAASPSNNRVGFRDPSPLAQAGSKALLLQSPSADFSKTTGFHSVKNGTMSQTYNFNSPINAKNALSQVMGVNNSR